MVRIFLILFSFICFINSANATWVVKELKDNQISVYVKGEQNPDHKMMFLFRFENCYRVAEYFALNKTSSTEEVNVLVNGKELNLPITKSGKTSLGKEIIFLFKGYSRPYNYIRYYSLNDKVNLKIKGTDIEETFDVSSIKSVLEDTVRQCNAKSGVYSFYSYAGKDYGDVIERHILNGEEYVVTQEATYQQLWKVNPETKEKESIGGFYAFGKFAEECIMIGEDPIFFAYVKKYYFAGGYMEPTYLTVFDLEGNKVGISPSWEYAEEFCDFY